MNIQSILVDAIAIITALLAIDNILDGIFKLFGLTQWDTQCANFANWLKKVQSTLLANTQQKG